MSFKAYFFRLRTSQDVDDLNNYLNVNSEGEPSNQWGGFLNGLYRPAKKFKKFAPSDIVAAITVDRGDLVTSFREEKQITRVPVFHTIYEVPDMPNDKFLIPIKVDGDTWATGCKKILEQAYMKKENHAHLQARNGNG